MLRSWRAHSGRRARAATPRQTTLSWERTPCGGRARREESPPRRRNARLAFLGSVGLVGTVGGAAALTLAGVLAFAAGIAGLAAALALAGVLPLAGMLVLFRLPDGPGGL